MFLFLIIFCKGKCTNILWNNSASMFRKVYKFCLSPICLFKNVKEDNLRTIFGLPCNLAMSSTVERGWTVSSVLEDIACLFACPGGYIK